MRVSHLLRKYNPAEWGGTETAIQQLTGGLRRHGVESVVFCPKVAGAPAADPLAESGCTVKRFRACVPIWGISQERRNQLLAVGGNLMSFNLIRQLAFEPNLSLVHSHALGRVGAIGRAIARRRGVPFIVTVHGGVYDLSPELRRAHFTPIAGGWEWGKPFGMMLRSRQLLSDADAIVTCNRREADLIREHHPEQYVYVQPHGVPAARFQADHRATAQAAFPAIAGRPFLLAIGRIDAVKNPGWAMVLPSLSETFGIVILEAWAAGVPVIASRTTGAVSLIESGESGWLFALNQPEAFHQGIDIVLGQPSVRNRWIALGRRRVEQEFDCDALAGQMKRLYEYTKEAKHAHRRIAG